MDGGIDPDPATRITGWVDDALRLTWSSDNRRVAFASRVAVSIDDNIEGDFATPQVVNSDDPVSSAYRKIFGVPSLDNGALAINLSAKTIGHRHIPPGAKLFSQIFVADVESRALEQLTEGEVHAFDPSWHPERDEILAVFSGEDLLKADPLKTSLNAIDISSKIVSPLVEAEKLRYRPRWSPDKKLLGVISSEGLMKVPTLEVFDARNGNKIWQSNSGEDFLFDFAWAKNSSELLAYGYRQGVQRFRLNDHGDSTPLPGGSDNVVSMSACSDNTVFALEYEPETLLSIAKHDATNGAVSQLFISPNLADYALADIRTLEWKTASGKSITGNILLPPDYDSARRYPVIIDAYPDTRGGRWFNPLGANHAWANAGYIVFQPAVGSPHTWVNRGSGDSDDYKGAAGWDVSVDEFMTGVDALIKEGFADPKRICLFGHSNGGGMVANLVTHTNRFRCAVIVAPAMTNWVRLPFYNPDYEGALRRLVGGLSLEQDPHEYVDLSPAYRMDRVATPILLAVGDEDGGFLLNAVELFSRLRAHDKEVVFVRYPGEGHILQGDALEDFWARKMVFFETHLKR